MKITKEQYKKEIRKDLARQRGNVVVSNIKIINAVLYVVENKCKSSALSKEYKINGRVYI